MATSADHKLAAEATPIIPGTPVAVHITSGRLAERGVYGVDPYERNGFILGVIVELDREVVLQRPNGDQPFEIEILP